MDVSREPGVRPLLTIIVLAGPDDLLSFEDTLASVLRNCPSDTEVIAVHGGTYTDPHDLGSVGVRLIELRGVATYGELFLASLPHVRSPFLFVVRPGITVDEGWADEALLEFENPAVASVSPLIVSEQHPDSLVTAGITCNAGFRPRLVGSGVTLRGNIESTFRSLGPTLWAGFFRTAIIRRVADSIHRFALQAVDLDLALTLRELGLTHVICPQSVVALEQPRSMVVEYKQVMGSASQRLLANHLAGSTLGRVRRTVSSFLTELLSAVVRPRNGLHAFQRIWAWPSVSDRSAFASIARLKADLHSADSLVPSPGERRAA